MARGQRRRLPQHLATARSCEWQHTATRNRGTKTRPNSFARSDRWHQDRESGTTHSACRKRPDRSSSLASWQLLWVREATAGPDRQPQGKHAATSTVRARQCIGGRRAEGRSERRIGAPDFAGRKQNQLRDASRERYHPGRGGTFSKWDWPVRVLRLFANRKVALVINQSRWVRLFYAQLCDRAILHPIRVSFVYREQGNV